MFINVYFTLDIVCRLSLYSGVIYHEYHLAKMDLIKRRWNSGDKKLLLQEIQAARHLLIKAQEVLKNEVSIGTGIKLAHLICDSLRDFGRWMDSKGINLENVVQTEQA